jgi:hypothetical protein
MLFDPTLLYICIQSSFLLQFLNFHLYTATLSILLYLLRSTRTKESSMGQLLDSLQTPKNESLVLGLYYSLEFSYRKSPKIEH